MSNKFFVNGIQIGNYESLAGLGRSIAECLDAKGSQDCRLSVIKDEDGSLEVRVCDIVSTDCED